MAIERKEDEIQGLDEILNERMTDCRTEVAKRIGKNKVIASAQSALARYGDGAVPFLAIFDKESLYLQLR